MPAGRPTVLTPEAVRIAGVLAARGLPLDMIADAIGVHRKTCHRWVREAEDESNTDTLKTQFRAAVFEAHRNTAEDMLKYITKSASDGNCWAATWMLTHHPALRDQFSDAAAERRAVQRALTGVVAAIDAAGLTDDQRTRLLLTMQAQGVGVQVEGE